MATSITIFEISRQLYGVTTDVVREFFRLPAIAPLPKAPRIIEGVVNIRGTAVPVLDLRSRFRLPAKPPHPADLLLVADAGTRMVALRVENVRESQRIDSGQLQDASTISPRAEYVSGILKLLDGIVLIHDLSTFLSTAEAMETDDAIGKLPDELS